MKKTAVAVALSLVTGSAFAVEALSGDQFTVSGEVAVGGYYDSSLNDDEVYNGGVTGFDIFTDYENGNIVGKFGGEFDIENDYGTSQSTFTITDTWVGYKTDLGVASIGYANDTALDAIDGAADQTIEFLWSPSDASDARQVVKFEGNKEGLIYGISYFGDRNYHDENSAEPAIKQDGINGYLGYGTEVFTVNLGYEDNGKAEGHVALADQTDKLMIVNGTVTSGDFGIGATFGEEEFADGTKVQLVNTSVGYTMEQVYLAAGYVIVEDTREAVNVGGSYAFTNNFSALVDIAYHVSDEGKVKNNIEKGDLESFVKLAYSF
ncbi:porin [Vibrio makurazakiensis]|uniref:porin n=1 Tax=Vibrio makurazakiensis TaxID=2910250 RepID=UPI003D126CBC